MIYRAQTDEKPVEKNIQVLFATDFKKLSKNSIKIERKDRLTPFDKAVHNAVATLWVAGYQDGKSFNEYANYPKLKQLRFLARFF